MKHEVVQSKTAVVRQIQALNARLGEDHVFEMGTSCLLGVMGELQKVIAAQPPWYRVEVEVRLRVAPPAELEQQDGEDRGA